MMRTSTPDRDVGRRRGEEDEEAFKGSFSKKTPPKKTAVSDRWDHYTFKPVLAAEKLVEFIRIVHPTHMLFYFQVGGYESAKAIRSMELWAERVVPMVEQALGMPIGEIEGAPP